MIEEAALKSHMCGIKQCSIFLGLGPTSKIMFYVASNLRLEKPLKSLEFHARKGVRNLDIDWLVFRLSW